MSILKSFFNNIIDVIFPRYCINCEKNIDNDFICYKCIEKHINTLCLLKNYYETDNDYLVLCYSLMRFSFNDISQKLIHNLKYKNMPKLGIWLGEILGNFLKLFRYDVLIPIPLHEKRIWQRGYNQSEQIAIGLQKALDIPIDTQSVIRNKNTKTQTTKDKRSRLLSLQSAFSVINPSNIENKRILLIDDLITTGSTMGACYNALHQCNPECITYVTLAYDP